MKKHFITLLLFIVPIATFSQHIIITKNGERLNGELQRLKTTQSPFSQRSTVTFQLGK
ncbi:MAG: hypothetical protein IPP46_15950 [Bacteroidetes bacterium]|nr:hypothetical protein [Bacteroidota bacterium]